MYMTQEDMTQWMNNRLVDWDDIYYKIITIEQK